MLSALYSGCKKINQDELTTDSIIKYVESVNNKTLKETVFDFNDEYKEDDALGVVNIGSSEITSYSEDGNILKIKVSYNGSHGNLTTTIFCKAGKAVFIRKNLETFDPPKYEKGSRIKDKIWNEYFVLDKKILEFRNNGGPIRFNKPDQLDLTTKFYELIKDFESYMRIIKSRESMLD